MDRHTHAAITLLRSIQHGPNRELAALTITEYLDHLGTQHPTMGQLLDFANAEQPTLTGINQ